jgi:Fe-S cluster assembly iron-binding protein IscA
LLHRGVVVWGAVAQANALLFSHGKADAPANIILARDFTFDDRPEDLVNIAHAVFELKGTTPTDPDLVEMARTITNEGNAVADFAVPAKLTGGARVLMTTVLITRSCLPGGILAGRFFPLVIDPEDAETSSLLSRDFWPADLAAQWQEVARSVPVDEEAMAESQRVKEGYLESARARAERGEYIRLTPAAAAEYLRIAGGQGWALEIRGIFSGRDFRYELNRVRSDKPCDFSFVSQGVEIHALSNMLILLEGVEIDYVGSGERRGFSVKRTDFPTEG